MSDILSGPRLDAKSGNATSLVLILHGYGADGNDLIGIGQALAEHMPDTTFLAPNAPDRCTNNPMGYQWFPIPWLDGSTEAAAMEGMTRASGLLHAWMDEVAVEEGIAPSRTALIGFSQGTMMSLQVAPRRPEAVAGVVGFSGRLLAPETLQAEVISKPPVLLVHGDQDDVVPPSSMPEAADALVAAGFETYTHVSKGTAHGIAPDGLGLALQFLREKLSLV